MKKLPENPTLKDITAFKKKITWGEVPAIYHMVSSSIGDADGIMSHGFESAYKRLLNKNTWNLDALEGYKDSMGNVHVKTKAQLILRHNYNDMGYELHCYPLIDGEMITRTIKNDARCPFTHWYPESMQMLFRINSLVAFSIYAYQGGDEADMALIKHAFICVEKLINILKESFDIVDIKGYNIAEFYQEIDNRQGNVLNTDSLNQSSE